MNLWQTYKKLSLQQLMEKDILWMYMYKAKKNLFMLFFFQGQNEWYQTKKIKWISFIYIHHEILYVLKVINFLPVN